MTTVRSSKSLFWWMILALCATWLATPSTALAGVRFDGAWNDGDQNVTLDAHQVTRQHALELLGQATGWNIVAQDVDDDTLDLSIQNQPAAKVLDMILSDGHYAATREGNEVTIEHEPSAAPANTASRTGASETAVSKAAVSKAAASSGAGATGAPAHEDGDRDRTVFGGNLRIERGERVEDVDVLGGKVDVWGVVEGDLTVLGGEAWLHDGAHVLGSVSTLGGSLHMDEHAWVDGDVEVLGGSVHRAPGAHVGGSMSASSDEVDSISAGLVDAPPAGWTFAGLVDDATGAITRTLLLFVFGAMFWALGKERMEALEVELAKRPMRSLALGVVSLLTTVLLLLVLTITVVGIPFAAAGLIMVVVVSYVGACVVLSTLGQALLRHRTENRYIHLALGCLLFLLFTAIPYVGTFVWFGVLLTGLGVVVATRGAGLVPMQARRTERGPYRTAAV